MTMIMMAMAMVWISLFAGLAVMCNGFSMISLPIELTSRHHYPQEHDDFRALLHQAHSCRRIVTTSSPSSSSSSTTTTALSMGVVDYFREKFLDSRDGDFIPLDRDDATFGRGPLIVMYAVPDSIDDEELMDMIQDGMGERSSDVVIRRINYGMDRNSSTDDALLDTSVDKALDVMMMMGERPTMFSSSAAPAASGSFPEIISSQERETPCPVLYFSGVSNTDMMKTYRIIANEIYQETNGVHWPACAKVVRPALDKSLRQVLSEISRDHADAMEMRRNETQQ